MDTKDFVRRINDPRRTRRDLEQLLKNCIEQEQMEFANIVKERLNERFPGWDRPPHRNAGAKPTIARFRSEEIQFDSQKEAYVWLIERFIRVKPDLFEAR